MWDTYVEKEGEAAIWGDDSNVPNTDAGPLISDRQSSIGLGYI